MRAVIFDWGGTLTPWLTVDHTQGWRAYADALHPDDPDRAAELADAIRLAEAAAWGRVRTEHRAFTIGQVLEAAGAPADEEAFRAYRDFWEHATYTDPEVPDMVEALRARGLRTGVLSSTSWPATWHEEWLHRDGVLDLFDALVWSSDLEYTKPHRDAFLAAMTAVGIDDPADCVYVGDRMFDDVSGAQAAGMRTVFIPNSDIPAAQLVPVDARPDATIRRLADLPAVVEPWLSRH
ncbi:MAG TPA: HAD family hydrolase [Actinophytocola sp.]|uniref:HAD family hydrolase n=1 Tax=Actinophytocola sp. TaxID=1872138 RepID=UPI002DB9424E|nr:HAD family hydrolase [Actinophytocola sp.]HEU5472164.1 HAD family hydrolase [Actinophytocola sp.]